MKLVRDRIPTIIELRESLNPLSPATRLPKISKADPEVYPRLLEAKLLEEVSEYMREPRQPDELVDILEVVYALGELHGLTRDELNEYCRIKRIDRGGFDNRIVLHRP